MTLKILVNEIEKLNKALEAIGSNERYYIKNVNEFYSDVFEAQTRKEFLKNLRYHNAASEELLNAEVKIKSSEYYVSEVTVTATWNCYGVEDIEVTELFYIKKR